MEKKKVSIYISEDNYEHLKDIKEKTRVSSSESIDSILTEYFSKGVVTPKHAEMTESEIPDSPAYQLKDIQDAIEQIINKQNLLLESTAACYRISDLASRLLYNGLSARAVDQGNNFVIRPDAATFNEIKRTVVQDYSKLRLNELATEDILDTRTNVTNADLYDIEHEAVNESKNHFSPIFTEEESQEKPSDLSKYNKLFNIVNGLDK